MCIEAQTGLVLAEENPDAPRPPASMVKMMLMLLVAEGLADNRWTLDTPVEATQHAQSMGGTQVFLAKGEVVPLGQLMRAVAVASANDAAMAVAEGLWGDEASYLTRMNKRAAELGMVNSEFHSVHGLPPDPSEKPDRTTARDMAILAQQCVKHPIILEWTAQKEFVFRPGESIKHNTNKLLWRMEECDGLKTGYINAAGFCLTATARRKDIRVITVLMGFDHSNNRFKRAKALIEEGFAEVRRVPAVTKGQILTRDVPVGNCETTRTSLIAREDVWVTVKAADVKRIEVVLGKAPTLEAPVAAGALLHKGQIRLDGEVLATVSVTVPSDLEAAGWGVEAEAERGAAFLSGKSASHRHDLRGLTHQRVIRRISVSESPRNTTGS